MPKNKSDANEADVPNPPSQKTEKQTKYVWLSVEARPDLPAGIASFTLPKLDGWEIVVQLSRKNRHYYEPVGDGEHSSEARLESTRDVKYLRLTRKDAEKWRKMLEEKRASDCGMSLFPFNATNTNSIRKNDPRMIDLVTVRVDEQPRDWRDCWYNEYWLKLVHAVTHEEDDYVNLRSPATSEQMDEADRLIETLKESDKPIIETLRNEIHNDDAFAA